MGVGGLSFRKQLYYSVKAATGSRSPDIFEQRMLALRAGIPTDTTDELLCSLLKHSSRNVPYYRGKIDPEIASSDAVNCLQTLPILSRELLRTEFESLKSADLSRRKWHVKTSGGSTGEPVKLIQDEQYKAGASANTLLFSALVGKFPGQHEVRLWGSERDIFENGVGYKANLQSYITNTSILNAFRMTPEKMREYINFLNTRRPRMLLAYAQALYELCQFAEDEAISVRPIPVAMTSAGTLHPFMRQKIEQVLGCRVYNRYGSREVGDIACELPADFGIEDGLWVSPWGCYVEVVDETGKAAPAGVEGDILVTSLGNFAMPLLRYRIGDRGILAEHTGLGPTGQVLKRVTGRVTDNFRTSNGSVVPGEYFIHLIGVVLNKGDIRKFQIVQRDCTDVLVKIVQSGKNIDTGAITQKIQLVMGADCKVEIQFLDEIPAAPSGKYRYTICEIQA